MKKRCNLSAALGLTAALLLWSALSPARAHAQYFGQNKVRYRTFDFKVLKTEHFDIHYYEEARDAAVMAGRMAERWHARLSKVLGHELSPAQPVILYDSHPAFRATSVIPDYIGETTGGVTEALRRRVVMPFAGPLAETDHVLGHELVHAFQYDMTSRAGPEGGAGVPGVLSLPLWFVEGMSEYLSLGPVDANTAMWLRDAVRRNDVPEIRKLDNPRYMPYRYGHALWAYVAGRFGDQVIGRMLKAASRGGGVPASIGSVLNVSLEELSRDWRQALRDAYEPVLRAAAPVEQGRLLIGKDTGGGELNVSPVLSPDGKWVAFYSERDLFSIDLFLADAETGKVRRKITRTAVDSHIDSLQFVNSAGAWSADGRTLAFGTVSRGRAELSLYDIGRGRVARRIPVPQIGEILGLTWSPDGRYIACTGVAGGLSALFRVDLQTGEVRRLTEEAYAVLHPAWSPDGRRIAVATDRFTTDLAELAFGAYRLALVDPDSGRMEPLPGFPAGKHINPQWSPDGSSLYFVSDRDGISNIYRYSFKEDAIYQITRVQTGVTGIAALSPAFSVAAGAGRLALSVFADGGYGIYVMEGETALNGRSVGAEMAGLEPASLTLAPAKAGEVASLLRDPAAGLAAPDGFKTVPYRPKLSLDYVAPPTVAVGMSSFGSLLGGGTALYWSDLLGYHNLMTAFQMTSATEARNFLKDLTALSIYQNERRRWTWGVAGGQIPYLTGSYGQALAVVQGEPALIEQTVRFWQINRELSGIYAYPFNRAQRLEFAGGYRNIAFSADAVVQAFSLRTGRLLLDERRDLEVPGALHMATGAAALVYDTSIFGGTSPVLGRSYRFEADAAAGSLNFFTLLGDYRRYYMPVRPLTIAGRLLHVGRYGGDAEDDRLQDLFLGYPSLVRGYGAGSFTVGECGPAAEDETSCPAFDRLLGSRIAVANAELRVPLVGPLGLVPSRSAPPVETAIFYDAGLAWGGDRRAAVLGSRRSSATSYGVSLRFNLLGFAIGQISLVHPNQRPLKNWLWEFSLTPGF